ncbi:MAG TPA: sodium/substrate symporter small subunit [Hyphomicrobiales bacterium]|nr:sodium/substrate symporter small subunit [Hyphomicrobiales bacterium]
MSADDAKHAYWRRIRRLTVAMTLAIAAFIIILPFFIPALNAYRILRFPLGYFLLADVGILGLAILLYAFFGAQQESDRIHNVTIQF